MRRSKYDVFISYSRRDSKIVKSVANRLKEAGLSVWIDEDGIESGDLFKKVITNAIENSACLLFFSSESSNNSTWTAKEIGIAIYEKIPVIPVILDDAKYNPEIKFDLVNLDFVDMKDEQFRDKSIARIVKSIKKLLQNSDIEAVDLSKSGKTPLHDPHGSDTQRNHKNDNSTISKNKTKSKLKAFLHQSFSYSNIHIALLVVLFLFGGIIGLLLYPFILIIYYEVRKRKGLVIPTYYIKYRKPVLITMGIVMAALLSLGGYLIYDTYKSSLVKSGYGNQIADEIVSKNRDADLKDSERESTEQTPYVGMKDDGSSTGIKMSGVLGNKEMNLYLLPSGRNRIEVELEINGTKFSSSYTPFLNRRTLIVDLDDVNGTYIGGLDGILTIENGILTYKGRAYSQGKTSLFKDGGFEFNGNANDAIIQMIESQMREK